MDTHDRLIPALTNRAEEDLAVLHGQVAALEPLTGDEQAAALTIDTAAPQAPQRLQEAVHAMDMQA